MERTTPTKIHLVDGTYELFRSFFGAPSKKAPDGRGVGATIGLLNLVGDAADGYPGVPGWGPKSASDVLSRYEHLKSIPKDHRLWGLGAARALRLAESLPAHRTERLLYRRLATLRRDVPLREKMQDLEWRGARDRPKPLCRELGANQLPERVPRWVSGSAGA